MTQSALVCGRCGSEALPEATFCYNCGGSLAYTSATYTAGRAPWTIKDIGKAIAVVITALVVTSIPASLIALAIAGGEDIEQDPAALTVALGASLFLELAMLLSAVYFSVRKYGVPWAVLGLRRPAKGGFWLTLGVAVGLVIVALMINFAYFAALGAVGVHPDTSIEEIFQSAGPLVMLFVLSLVFAPLMEEVFFRGFVFGGLRGRWGVAWAAVASGLLFSVAHIGNPGTIYLIPPVAAIGAVFAWGYAYTDSLLTSWLAHFLFNLIAFASGVAQYS